MLNKNSIAALATVIGGTLGAGMFGIPYVFSRVGIIPATIGTLILGTLLIILNLLLAEVTLSTPGKLNFVQLVQKLLPPKYSYIAIFTTCLQFFISLFAYVTLFTGFLNAVLPPARAQLPAVGATVYSIVIWVILFKGLSAIKKYDKIIVGIFLASLLIIIWRAAPAVPLNNILHTDMSQRFIIYGVVIYALNGVSSIPIIQECLGADKKKLPHLIIGGGILCMILAIAWWRAVAGISGAWTSQDAITGLSAHFGTRIVKLGGVVGIFAITSPHLIIGEHLIEILRDFFRISHRTARAFTILLPLLILLYIGGGFIETIGFAGSVFLGTMGIFVGAMNLVLHYKHGKTQQRILPHNKLRSYALIILFSLGIIYEILKEFFL